ncbi:phosphoenolpyruvate--protein phosphotransferase [candidate division KSB1 bacterium]|nr:phosphoenolpyruvate--protein phosphotransferase [candidate division KSB1 bacterium]
MARKRRRLHGSGISPGIGKGYVCIWGPAPAPKRRKIRAGQVPSELNRLKDAITSSRDQLTELKSKVHQKVGSKESEIFEAHSMFLNDPFFLTKIERRVMEKFINVEAALEDTINEITQVYANIEDPYLKERMQDIRDIGRRLMDNLVGHKQDCTIENENEVIVVTEELTASQLMDLDHSTITGFITEKGGATSHSAILARSLGIPLVSGVPNVMTRIKPGSFLLINGFNGDIVRQPSDSLIRDIRQHFPSLYISQDEMNELEKQPSTTADGVLIQLLSNVRSNGDLEYIKHSQAVGIGLYRTEMAFINRKNFPSEEEQFDVYKVAVESMAPQPVTIRTIDLGGDKFSPYFPHSRKRELNPHLGLRSIRVSLAKPDVFRTQLRAILRASALGKIKLMLPLISNIEEIRLTKRMLYRTMVELKRENIPFDENLELGVMIEIPAAVLIINAILREVDFISVGTNDLIQYTLAVDRSNETVSEYYEPAHPAVLMQLKQIVDAANRMKKDVSICGEMAADLQYTKLLLGLGYRNLSMSPFFIPQIKRAIRCIDMDAAHEFAMQVLSLSEVRKIKKLLMDDLVCK